MVLTADPNKIYVISGELYKQIRHEIIFQRDKELTFKVRNLNSLEYCEIDDTTYNPEKAEIENVEQGMIPQWFGVIYSRAWFYLGFGNYCIMIPRSIYKTGRISNQ